MAFRLDVFDTIAKKIKAKQKEKAEKKAEQELPAKDAEPKELSSTADSQDEAVGGGTESPPVEMGGAEKSIGEEQAAPEIPKKKPSPVPKGHLISQEAVAEFGLPEMAPHQKTKKRAVYTGERSLVKFHETDSAGTTSQTEARSSGQADLWEPEAPHEKSDIGHKPVFEEEPNPWADAEISTPVQKVTGTIPSGKEQGFTERPSKRKLGSRSDQIITGTGIGADRFTDPLQPGRKKTRFVESPDAGRNRFSDEPSGGRIQETRRSGTRLERFSEESGMGVTVSPDDISEPRSRKQKSSMTERFSEEAGLGITAAPDSPVEHGSRKRTGTRIETFSEEAGLGVNAAPNDLAETSSRKRTSTRIEEFVEEAGLGVTSVPDDLAENGKRKRMGTKTERFSEEAGLGITASPNEDIESESRKRTGVKTERFHEKEGLGIKTRPNGPESDEGRVRTGVDSEWFWEDTGMGADRIHDEKGKQKVGKIIDVDDLKSERRKHRLLKK